MRLFELNTVIKSYVEESGIALIPSVAQIDKPTDVESRQRKVVNNGSSPLRTHTSGGTHK
eukprot:scaffold47568_cov16-Prasinocladus_malaysianus.AAC.2